MGNFINRIIGGSSKNNEQENSGYIYNPVYLSQDAEQHLLDNGYALVDGVWVYTSAMISEYINIEPINEVLYGQEDGDLYDESGIFSDDDIDV
jgi:hypothetical protein